MIIVHQINLTDEQIATINRTGSHDSVPAQRVRLKTQFDGSEGFDHSDFKFYEEAIKVDTDDLEEAFMLTNLWNDHSRVFALGDHHSTSVGDILQKGDRYFMVEDFGFEEIYFFQDELEA